MRKLLYIFLCLNFVLASNPNIVAATPGLSGIPLSVIFDSFSEDVKPVTISFSNFFSSFKTIVPFVLLNELLT